MSIHPFALHLSVVLWGMALGVSRDYSYDVWISLGVVESDLRSLARS